MKKISAVIATICMFSVAQAQEVSKPPGREAHRWHALQYWCGLPSANGLRCQ